jgi:LmbE family N-acetylglucosaminyl deacetylase
VPNARPSRRRSPRTQVAEAPHVATRPAGADAAAAPAEELERVLVIAVHPDDPEFGAAGTIAKWARQGREITYLLITSGDKGSHDRGRRPEEIAAIREEEQRAAAAALGVKEVHFLRHADGLVEPTVALRRELCGWVRRLEPHIVMTMDPWRRYQLHPDHRACGWVALDAVWAAREWNIFAEQVRPGHDPWRVKEVYLFWTDDPDYWEDVGQTHELRFKALEAHTSQTGGRMDRIRERFDRACRETGATADPACDLAEAFKLLKLG